MSKWTREDAQKVFDALHQSSPIPEAIRHLPGAEQLHHEAHTIARDYLATLDQPEADESLTIAYQLGRYDRRKSVEGKALSDICQNAPLLRQPEPADAGVTRYCDAEIRLNIEYSHNYATARPDTPHIVKEHILGLCERLQSLLDERIAARHAIGGQADAVSDEDVMLFRRFIEDQTNFVIEWNDARSALESFAARHARGVPDVSAELCPNCNSPLPRGCGGIFKDEPECLAAQTTKDADHE